MKESGKTNNKAKDKANGNSSGPMLKFNHVRRETLPQTRIDVRALEMVRGYPLYVKEHTDHEPPIGEVLEQCIINTLSGDADFILGLMRQVVEPGKFASWIAPPLRGIDNKPGDFEYVKLAA